MDFKTKKAIMYGIAKEIYNGNNSFNYQDLNISKFDFVNILIEMQDNHNLIADVQFFFQGEVCLDGCILTFDGEKFLNDNSKLSKVYDGLKKIKDLIPFI